MKSYKEKKMEVAFFWGRLLSPTFDKKSPFLCELAGICAFLSSCKYFVMGKVLHILTDNLVAVGILKRRFQLMDSFDDGVVHRLLVSISGYRFTVSYANTKCNAADFLSRFSQKHGATYG